MVLKFNFVYKLDMISRFGFTVVIGSVVLFFGSSNDAIVYYCSIERGLIMMSLKSNFEIFRD